MIESSIAAVILTKNEEQDLRACLLSLQGVVSQVLVVDSGSTDRTVEIAEEFGAHVVRHQFTSYAPQFNWALDSQTITAGWILRIDADERLSPALRNSLKELAADCGQEVNGIELARLTKFLGRELRHGDTYPVWLLRMFRRGTGRLEETWMDEHVVLKQGETCRAHGDLIHEIPKSLSDWTRKHVWYAERECLDIQGNNRVEARLEGQAGFRRLVKQKVYLRLPRFVRAFTYWLYRYVVRFGFLDGLPGLIYHLLQGFWYRFLVDSLLCEMDLRAARDVRNLTTAESK